MKQHEVSLNAHQQEIVRKIRDIRPGRRVHYHTSEGTMVTEDSDPAVRFIFQIAREANQNGTAVCMQRKLGKGFKTFEYFVIGITIDTKRRINRLQASSQISRK